MFGSQYAHFRLGHRANRGNAQGKIVQLLQTVYMIVFSSVLLVRPIFAQELAYMSSVQESLEPWESSGGPVNTTSNTIWERQSATLDGRQLLDVVRLPQVAPSGGSQSWIHREPESSGEEFWTWHVLPDGVIYPAYLARTKESRFAGVWNHDANLGSMWDIALGGRAAILRYGTEASQRVDGWELDIEGAAFPRLDLDHDEDLISADFRFGIPLTFGSGPFQAKLAGYHLSSHLGDEFLVRFPSYQRINYSRNAIVLGGSYYLTDDLRIYAEAEYGFYTDGGTKPWQFQFGIDYSPVRCSRSCRGSPFLALNGQLREEVDYGGNFVVQAGWQWRGGSNHLTRVGVQYFTGKSEQFQFFRRNEEKIGFGIWYDY